MRLSYFNSSVIYVAEIRHLTKSNLGEEKVYFRLQVAVHHWRNSSKSLKAAQLAYSYNMTSYQRRKHGIHCLLASSQATL